MKRLILTLALLGMVGFLGISCSSTSESTDCPRVAAPAPASGTGHAVRPTGVSDPETLATRALGDEKPPMAEPVDWARLSGARVSRLDWNKQVAMLDVGSREGVGHGSHIYTYRKNLLTGVLIPVKVFDHVSICAVGSVPAGKNTGKIHVGDRIVPSIHTAYVQSVYPEAVLKQINEAKAGTPGEEGLKSLQESMIILEEIGQRDEEIARAKKTAEEQRKQVEDAWKDAVARIKQYQETLPRN